jgi:Tfp pilus assembly protein PilF
VRTAILSAISLALLAALAAAAVAPPNLQEALVAQRALAADHPGDPQVLNDLGNLLVLAGELQEAEETYHRSLELAPENATTRYNLALVLAERQLDRQAIRELEEVIRIDPGHAWAHYQLGTLHQVEGRRSKAVEHYTQAFLLDAELTSLAVNPHFVENRLATEAMLRAYTIRSKAAEAPRLYQQPGHVADLLAPPPPASSTETEEAVAEPPRQPIQLQLEDSGAPPEQPTAPATRVEPPTARTPSSASPVNRPPDATSAPRTSTETGSPSAISGRADQAAPDRRSPVGAPSTSIATPPNSTQPRSPGGAGFRPGVSSTGRLELQLLPGPREPAEAVAP